MKLEDIAEVLRFQDKRESAYEDEETDRNGLVYGEAKPDDFDPVTGFPVPAACRVWAFSGSRKKYALRINDLLMFYNGAMDKIGLTGMVIDDVVAVSARILCIIRPYAVHRRDFSCTCEPEPYGMILLNWPAPPLPKQRAYWVWTHCELRD